MRISDWSSDVCSSDLDRERFPRRIQQNGKIPFAFEDSAIPVKSTMHAHVAGLLVRKHFVDERGDHFRVLVMHPAQFSEALAHDIRRVPAKHRSAEHTPELQSLMRTPYAVFCLKHKT